MAFLELPDIHKRLDKNTSVEQYYDKMSKVGEPADPIMILTAATVFKRRIIVYPIFPQPHPFIQYNPEAAAGQTKGEFHLLHYSSANFTKDIYKSIIQDKPKRLSLPSDSDPKSSSINESITVQTNPHLQVSPIQPVPSNPNKDDSFDDLLDMDDSPQKSPELSDSEKLKLDRKRRRQKLRKQRAEEQKKQANFSD